MPVSQQFLSRLKKSLPEIIAAHGTPFHIYDELGILESNRALSEAFRDIKFKQFFAVKALPNPAILKILHAAGSGMDCASLTELELVRRSGIKGEDILFTANNASSQSREEAIRQDAWITMDDITCLKDYTKLPDIIAFRVAIPNQKNTLMGGEESKFGVPIEEIYQAYQKAIDMGATRFGIHQMTNANTLNVDNMLDGACKLIKLASDISKELHIDFEYINIGGGIGIPYRPEEISFDLNTFSSTIIDSLHQFFKKLPVLFMECGRFITGPHGVLVSRVQTLTRKYRDIIGIDASMSALMRPALYKNAYHHISFPFIESENFKEYDVVGSLCENIDKFAIKRYLPTPCINDVTIIEDTGAHGYSMGFNYNGHLRPAEILMRKNGVSSLIRRSETYEDYTGTIVDIEDL